MTEITAQISAEVPRRNYPNLRFEPGIHMDPDTRPREWNEIIQRIARGDPDAHIWNQGVIDRMIETSPRFIAIDSLSFVEVLGTTTEIAPPFAETVWRSLPARPELIRPKERSVYVIAGDVFWGMSTPFKVSLAHPQAEQYNDIGKAIHDQIKEDYQRVGKDFTADASALVSAVILIDTVLGGALAINIIRKMKNHQISRRTVLGSTGIIAAGAALFGLSNLYRNQRIDSQYRAGEAASEAEKDTLLDIVDITEPRLIKSKQTGMRTAAKILKAKDAIDALGLPEDTAAAVLMGATHSFDARDFLASDETCQKAIREYVDTIDPILRRALERHPGLMTYKEARERMVDILAQTYIMKVDEPDHSAFWTPGFLDAVNASISVVEPPGGFKSKRVLAAFN